MKFINNLVDTPLNIDLRYMTNTSSMEETVFVDHVRVIDDTKNWFMRREGEVAFQGIASNVNTLMAMSRNIDGVGPYY